MKKIPLLLQSLFILSISLSAQSTSNDDSDEVAPGSGLDEIPQFPGGLAGFHEYAHANIHAQASSFNNRTDLLLAQYDCKTDVDDLHSAAGFYTLLGNEKYKGIEYHAVAGTYGIQEGLYVPPNDLFELAFGENWSDAHNVFDSALEKVSSLVKITLSNGGDIWIAEAGQSDFTAALIKSIQTQLPEINTIKRFHLIQHGAWNEKVTSPENLVFVKENVDYLKIPDGNVIGNGTPGFRSPNFDEWRELIGDNQLKKVWQKAIDLSLKYNAKGGRYNNEAVASGGLDFSDLVEICWILDLPEMKDSKDFFERYAY